LLFRGPIMKETLATSA